MGTLRANNEWITSSEELTNHIMKTNQIFDFYKDEMTKIKFNYFSPSGVELNNFWRFRNENIRNEVMKELIDYFIEGNKEHL